MNQLPKPAVVCADSNCSKQAFAIQFGETIAQKASVGIVPDANDAKATTTSKHRSLLHGQTYSKKKSLNTVTVMKDRIIGTTEGNWSIGTDVQIHPYLGDTIMANGKEDRPTLPTTEWPSDHSLIWTTYTQGEN